MWEPYKQSLQKVLPHITIKCVLGSSQISNVSGKQVTQAIY